MSTTTLPELRNFRYRVDDNDTAWLGLDCVGSSVNRLSRDVVDELMKALDYFARNTPAAIVIHSCKPSGFIAGADIAEFDALESAEAARALIANGWDAFERLSTLPCPTLALIRGHCLGGGLELALACRYRLAVDQADTSLALPEVMLGIFPAWGGMRRLPALIGAPAALDMMLTGRTADARKAASLGLVDARVAPRLQMRAASELVRSGMRPRRARGIGRLLNLPFARPLVMKQAEKKLDQRDPYQHYMAPRAILEIWGRHGGNALKAPALIDDVVRSGTARNLIRVFHLQERLKAFGRAPEPAASETLPDPAQPGATTKTALEAAAVRHVHVVGAGAMGGDIAAWCALKGLKVTLQDQGREHIAAAQGRAQTLFSRRLKDTRQQRSAMDRLMPDPCGHGASHADLVIEAITESLEAKHLLYASIEPRMKTGAVLATNTSSLSLEALRTPLSDPSRLVGIHFFNPVAKMPLVEVVQADGTSPAAHATALAFVRQLGKLPLPVKDAPGFLVNAVLAPYLLEAMRCVDEGLSPETIDEAMKVFGMPVGPLELADTVGLDIAQAAGEHLAAADSVPQSLQSHLSRDELGRKTGQGFYTWKDGKAVKQASGTPPAGLAHRLIAPLVASTHERVEQGIVADADLADAGVVFGTGFAPFSGGPLHWERHMAPGVTPV